MKCWKVFPEALVVVCSSVGLACLGFLFYLLHYCKPRVDKVVNEDMQRLLLKKEISEFIQKIKKKKITFRIVRDFYNQFVDVNKPNRYLKNSWTFFLLAGISFIACAIMGSLPLEGELVIIETFAYSALFYAVAFLIVGLFNLQRLAKFIL